MMDRFRHPRNVGEVEDALRITELEVVDAHDGLPPIKMHCSKLAAGGLREAIVDYMMGTR